MPPLLVATDIDGTLVGPDGLVTARTASALAAVDALGVPVVFATARPLRWMEPLWPYVGRHRLAVVSNGAILYDVPGRAVLDVAGIGAALVRSLLADLAGEIPEAGLGVEYVSGLRRNARYTPAEEPDTSVLCDPSEPWPEPAVKMLVKCFEMPPDELRARVGEVVADRAHATWSTPHLVEITAPGVTKAWRLAQICATLGIDAADVVAFGDMPIDLEMLGWAGTSYAMADGHPSVLAAATHVAPACADDGVAAVLSELYGLEL